MQSKIWTHITILCYFYSVSGLKGKKFLELDWNIVYGFTNSDFEVRALSDTKRNSDNYWHICHRIDCHQFSEDDDGDSY